METAIEELLTAGLFHCSVCKQLLTPPVWLTPDITNLCNDCYQQWPDAFSEARENIPFTRIFEKLLFPCPHRNDGCEETMPSSDYQKHVRGCPEAIQICLLPGCRWDGTTKDLMMHLCDEHPDIVLDEKDGVFPLQLCDNETEAINVVHTHARFITRIKVNLETVQVAIFNFDHDLKQDVGEFALEYACGPDARTQHKCNISDDIGSLQTLGGESGTEFLPHARFAVSSLKLCKIGGKKPKISEELLPYVTCSRCKKYLRKPFVECTLGHYTCNRCFRKSSCTKCKTPLVRIEEDKKSFCRSCKTLISASSEDVWNFRNGVYLCSSCKTLEQWQNSSSHHTPIRSSNISDTLLGQFSFPCQFGALGCKFTGPWFGQQRRHEEVCDYRTLTCPQADCGLQLRYTQMLLHMMTDHREICVAGDTHNFLQQLDTGMINFKFFLICHNKLFVHQFRFSNASHKYEWDVSKIQGNGNDDYVFAISMEGRADQMLSLQQSCRWKMTLYADNVEDFVKDGKLAYRLKVTERSDSK